MAEKKYIDADYLMEGCVSNDPVVIAVKCAPAADVQEVKHGKWEQQTEPLGWEDVDCAVCSVCGESVILTDSDMDIDDIRNWWNYCPCCGAKMDGKENGE